MIRHNPDPLPACFQELLDTVCDFRKKRVDVPGKFPSAVMTFVVDVAKLTPSHTLAIAVSRALKDRPSSVGEQFLQVIAAF